MDPYLFENFNTADGDTLTARFRAFKFPETNFVLFRGTIDVCLDRCSGVRIVYSCFILFMFSFPPDKLSVTIQTRLIAELRKIEEILR